MHVRAADQLRGGPVPARPPGEADGRPVALERPGEQRQRRITTGDREHGMFGDEAAGLDGLAGRERGPLDDGERGTEARGERLVSGEREDRRVVSDAGHQQSYRIARLRPVNVGDERPGRGRKRRRAPEQLLDGRAQRGGQRDGDLERG
jgi:hypothetical protein